MFLKINEKIDDKLLQFDKKNITLDPYKACDALLNNKQTIDKALDLWDSDKVIVNSLLFENVANYIFKNRIVLLNFVDLVYMYLK